MGLILNNNIIMIAAKRITQAAFNSHLQLLTGHDYFAWGPLGSFDHAAMKLVVIAQILKVYALILIFYRFSSEPSANRCWRVW